MSGEQFRLAFELAREAQDAGLVVTCLAPHRCDHSTGSDEFEFQVGLYQPDGQLWAEGRHEDADTVREHIRGWANRRGRPPAADRPVGLAERVAAVRTVRPELGPVLGIVDTMLGGDPYQEGRHAVEILEALERLESLSPDGDSLFVDIGVSAVTFTQTTDRHLRVAVNGAWTLAFPRERVTLDVRRPAPWSGRVHLLLPHPTRVHRRDPGPGEVVVRLFPADVAAGFGLSDAVQVTGAWMESDPPMLLLRLRGDVDQVRAAFPGATEFDGPREAL